MNMSGILVHNIGDCLQTAAALFDWSSKIKNALGIIVRNFEAISHEYRVTHLHLRAIGVNLELNCRIMYPETQLHELSIIRAARKAVLYLHPGRF